MTNQSKTPGIDWPEFLAAARRACAWRAFRVEAELAIAQRA